MPGCLRFGGNRGASRIRAGWIRVSSAYAQGHETQAMKAPLRGPAASRSPASAARWAASWGRSILARPAVVSVPAGPASSSGRACCVWRSLAGSLFKFSGALGAWSLRLRPKTKGTAGGRVLGRSTCPAWRPCRRGAGALGCCQRRRWWPQYGPCPPATAASCTLRLWIGRMLTQTRNAAVGRACDLPRVGLQLKVQNHSC
jgi:hypothetical protein